LGGAAALAVLAALVLRLPAVEDRILDAALRRLVVVPGELFADDAMRVLLCGTSSPFPHPTRARPCTAVFAGGRFFVVDAGPGSWNRLALWRVDGARIGGVLLSHFHSDHIGELGEFDLQTWVAGRPGPLRVFGPPGVERVVAGFEEAYALDAGYRIAHHGADLLSPETARMEPHVVRAPGVVLEEQGLRITAVEVGHHPVAPAFGYRFDWGGRSVVVSGDTVKDARLIEAARGADVLVHEAQANHVVARIREAAERAGRTGMARILGDIPDYHTAPVDAAAAANEAGVKLLLLTHLTPPPTPGLLERIFVRGVSEVRRDGWILGDDGLLVELPAGSQQVVVGELD
jgi:ribonuclease Z